MKYTDMVIFNVNGNDYWCREPHSEIVIEAIETSVLFGMNRPQMYNYVRSSLKGVHESCFSMSARDRG